jgi:hypothetical protein
MKPEDFFARFRKLEMAGVASLGSKLGKPPVGLLWVSPHDHRHNLMRCLEEIGVPADAVAIDHKPILQPQGILPADYQIVFGAMSHSHPESALNYPESHEGRQREIGDFLEKAEFSVYYDCCHGAAGSHSGADVWLGAGQYLYLAWAVKDFHEGVDDYLALKRDFAGVVGLALKNNDIARARSFALIARIEIADMKHGVGDKDALLENLSEVLLKSGNAGLIVEHYTALKAKAAAAVEKAGRNDPALTPVDAMRIVRNIVMPHYELFKRINPALSKAVYDPETLLQERDYI